MRKIKLLLIKQNHDFLFFLVLADFQENSLLKKRYLKSDAIYGLKLLCK